VVTFAEVGKDAKLPMSGKPTAHILELIAELEEEGVL
jgi:hypothetical protein